MFLIFAGEMLTFLPYLFEFQNHLLKPFQISLLVELL